MAHILLVDDEPEVLNAISRVLRKDYKISKANSAHEALKLIADNEFDIILSDIRMPNMDGIELLTQIKRTTPEIARVLLSGYSDMDACQKAIEDEVASIILTKPWDNFELKNILKITLKAQQLEIENNQLKAQLRAQIA
ncbi:MAG: response regulator [Pseudoalteromonas sp.]|nr:response regulator [Pseudoalteromonas sp.]